MKIKLLFICILCMGIGSLSAQTIRYVKPVSSGNGTGSSWGNASNNLQAMITASVAGDQVWVAAGTYKPGTSSSARTVTFSLNSGVKVYGSFAGYETSVAQRNIAANSTILSGDLNGNDVPSSNPMLLSGNSTMSTNAYHVVTASGLNTNSVFDGFTITGGYANDAGIAANGSGGGLYVSASEGTFSNLVIKNCYAFFGGGISLSLGDNSPRFNGIWISECTAGANGANDGSAIYKQSNIGTPEFFNMVVTNCAGSRAVSATNANITNSTFYNIYTGSTLNYPYDAVVYGANMYNCIIGQHSLPYAVYNVTSKYLENNSFYGVVQAATDSWYRKENITNNGDAGFVDAANGNFRLVESSACINTGDPENLNLYSSISRGYTPITTDIAGNAREIGTIDRGAYEFGQTSIKYVKQIASGTGDGSSWENASSDLQLMINQSSAGDQIWVAKGTYKPVRQANSIAITPNNRDNTFFLKAGVEIYGSFAGGETTIAGRQFQTNATILSGDFSNNDPDNTTNALAISGSTLLNENAYHIVLGVDIQDVVFDGFVLKGGVANGTGVVSLSDDVFNPLDIPRDFGGGMYLIRVQGQFNNIAVRSSLASSGGGGIFTSNVSNYLTRFNGLIITGCLGGATGAGKGSAVYVKGTTDSTVELFNMLVTNCVGSSSVYVTSSKAVAYFSNATFYGVSVNDAAATTAGVIETASGGSVVFNNSIIGLHAYPYAFNIGWASNIGSNSSNSSIYKTKTGQGTFTATNNTTNTGNPGFINAAAGDFGLTSSSAVRNLGNVSFLSTTVGSQYQYPAVTKDVIGNPRLFQGGLDLGAYQYKPACEIPAAPTAADQSLCAGSTVASLTASGTGIKWYLNATGGSALSSSTTLSTRGYFVSQTTGVCESERIEVNVTVLTAPAAPSISSQTFCGPSTAANLIALNSNFRWYAASTGGTPLAPTTALVNNTTYYASQVNTAGCEGTRTSVLVRIGTIPAAPTATSSQLFCGTAKVSDLQSSATSPRWYTAMTGGFALSANTSVATGTYYVSQMGTSCESTRTAVEVTVTPVPSAPVAASAQTFCGSGIVDNLIASGENLIWYDSSFNTVSSNTVLSNGTYYVTQTINGCTSAATAVNVTIQALPAQPTASPQTLCEGSTVASLTATGTNLKWYAAVTGGAALQANALLNTGTYYVTQSSAAGCESARKTVQVTISPLPPAPGASALQTFCGTASVADLESDAPETKWYTTLTGGTSLPYNTALTTGMYYGSQMNVICESARTAVQVVVNPIPQAPAASSQLFCGEGTVAGLIASGSNLKWYADETGGSALSSGTSLSTGTYYVSQSSGDCESARTAVNVTVKAMLAQPTAFAQSFCGDVTVNMLTATGLNIKWYADATGGSALEASTLVNTGTYYVTQSDTNCESLRLAVNITANPVPLAPAADAQSFCGSATVADLAAAGSEIKWYATATSEEELTSATSVSNGIYYVSQTVNGCVSSRTGVQVITNTAPVAPSAENHILCANSLVSDLSASGVNLTWYNQAEGGVALEATEQLVDGTYYVSQNNGCESARTAVAVVLSENCTALLAEHCGAAVTFNTRLYVQTISGATTYRFHVTNGANVQVFENSVPYFRLNHLSSYIYGTTYTVKVSVFKDGIWSPYGRECTVSTPALPTSKLSDGYCGNTYSSFGTAIYADEVALATNYRFRVTDGITTQIIDKPSRVFNISNITGYGYGKVYTIDVAVKINGVYGNYGTQCTLSIIPMAVTQLSTGYCGMTVTSFGTAIYADNVTQATAYRFKISDGVTTQVIEKPTRVFTISNFTGYTYDKTYTVEVAAMISGVFTSYGPSCTVTTMPQPLTQLSAAYCGITVPTGGSALYANEVALATGYRFRVTNGASVSVIDRPTRVFSLSKIPGFAYGVTYTIEVTALVNGTPGAYGAACTATAQANITSRFREEDVTNTNAITAKQAITLTAYPNPYADVFSIEMNTENLEKVTVRAFDITGKLVDDITVSPEVLASQKLGSRYQAGIYNVIVIQGDYNKSFRVVKQ